MINIIAVIVLAILYTALVILSVKTGRTRLFRTVYGLMTGTGFLLFGLSYILQRTVAPGELKTPADSAPDSIFWQIMLPLYAVFIVINIAAVFVAYSRESKLNSFLRTLCIIMSPVLSVFMILMSFLANGLQYMTSVTFASIGALGLSLAVKVMDYIRLYLKGKKYEEF